jgi:peroxiredoxin
MLIAACSGTQTGHPDEYVIKGKLKNSKGEMIRLQVLTVDSLGTIDSMAIDDEGTFTFRGKIESAGFYLLGTGPENFITLLLDKGEDLQIEGNAMALSDDYSVKGSPGSELLMQLNSHTRENYRKSDSLLNVINTSQVHPRFDSIKHRVDSSYTLLFEDQQKYIRNFIKSNDSSLASLMALYQVFGRIKVVNEKDDLDLYVLLNDKLSKRYPGNEYVAELNARVARIKEDEAAREHRERLLDSGNIAPEIDLKTMTGYPVKLSSQKGRVVLVFFWAGWSLPSQQPISFYKFLYKKYGPKGFTIYGVSLDKDRQTWEDAVRENTMNWTQVSDLMEWESPLVKDYNISSIPVAFLLDRDGKILLKRPDNTALAKELFRIYKF